MTTLRSAVLGTAAAIALLAGGAAYAQTESPATGQSGGQIQQELGASGQAGGGADITAQGQAGAEIQGQAGASGEAGTQAEGDVQAQTETETQAQEETGAQAQSDTGTQAESDTGAQAQSDTGTQTQEETGTQAQSESSAEADSEAKAKVALDQTQVTEIKQFFTENEPDIESVDVSSVQVSVGVAVPSAVVLHPLPSAIVVNVPSDCPLEYFLWGTDIVIVDSCTRLVLEIIPDVA